MKKFIIIAVLLCLSAMTFKTEAQEINQIEDKEFLEFFKKFQNDLKETKGNNWDIAWTISSLLDYYPRNSFEEPDSFARFIVVLTTDYKEICNISAKNGYRVKKKNRNYYWWIDKRDGEDYSLSCGTGEGCITCIFGKIDGNWVITGVNQVG